MSVPVNTFVGVDIAVAPKAKGTKGFGTLAFVSTAASPTISELERFRKYTSFDSVTADFPEGEVYKAAAAYYAQTPTPVDFIAVGVYGVESAATLVGGTTGTLEELQAVTAGGFTIDVDGTPQVLSDMDFSGITSFDDAVAILQTEFGATVTVTYANSVFTLTTTAVGGAATLSLPTAGVQDLDTILGLNAGALSQGSDQESPADALVALWDMNRDTYGVSLDNAYNDVEADIVAVATWVEAAKRTFFNTTNDAATLLTGPSGEDCIAAKLKTQNFERTLSYFTSAATEYPSCSVAGRAFTVNFEGSNTTITLMYKKLPTITAMNLTPSQYAAMVEKNCNSFIDVDGISMYATAAMASGTFFDVVHGTDWLQNSIETGVFNLLYRTTTKIPYTDTGVGMVIQRVEQSLIQGVTNGLIAPGNTPEGDYLPLGYEVTYIPVSDVSASDKSARLYRGITFRAVGAGALHEVDISGSFSE